MTDTVSKAAKATALRTALTGNFALDQARERWDRCEEWESDFRRRFVADVQFANADSDNGWQWPDGLRATRDTAAKPCLTINIIRQHNLMISNELRKNKSSVKVVGVGNGATAESAGVFRDLIRRIEYQSQAQASVYSVARKWQIDGGIGWVRIKTDYADELSFDQEIFLHPVLDPLTVYVDPDCKQADCSDAKFLFAFDRMLPEELESLYPDQGPWERSPLQIGPNSGIDNDDRCVVLEYFVKVETQDTLVSFIGPSGKRSEMLKSKLKQMEGWQEVIKDPLTKTRRVTTPEIRRYFITGSRALGEPGDPVDEDDNPYQVWAGKYIPFVPVKGEEIVLRGRLDRKGHTRAMKDSQRMFNYNASSQVEHIAMQGKTPYTGAVEAIAGLEKYWNTANSTNHSFLGYNVVDSEGNPIPPQAYPRREPPPQASPAYAEMLDRSFNWMMMASGQWQNQMGMQGNERTGEAIKQRQAQGDTATFHYQDNYEAALQSIGRQLIDLIPKIYDTARVIKIVAEDGAEQEVEINPGAREAYLQELDHNNEVVKRIFNPSVGKYDVAASVGPAYGTKREETVEALTLILTQNPSLTGLVGDLLLAAMEFPEAQEAARRLKRMVPPVALGQGPTAKETELQQMVAALQLELTKSLEKQAMDQIKLVGKDQMRDIDVYKAETDRMKVILPLHQEAVAGQLAQDAAATSLVPVMQANTTGIKDQAGDEEIQAPEEAVSAASPSHPSAIPGAQQAPDGHWYVADPTRPGKHLRVEPKGQADGQ